MNKLLALACALAVSMIAWGWAAPALAAAPGAVTVAVTPTQVAAVLGGHFTIKTDLTNTSAAASGPLLAHLNIASVAGDVYVDPEDWSSNRSRQISLQPHETRTMTWELQAVTAGSFAVYVVVLPFDPGTSTSSNTAGNEPLVVSHMVGLAVANRSTLSAGGALPVALFIPLALGLAAVWTRWRQRRMR